jgi:F-type H+-transporting ATPase subunit alpha
MTEAEIALREAVADIPAAVRERLDTAEELRNEDRETVIRIARKALARFQPEPEPELRPDVQTKATPKLELEQKS